MASSYDDSKVQERFDPYRPLVLAVARLIADPLVDDPSIPNEGISARIRVLLSLSPDANKELRVALRDIDSEQVLDRILKTIPDDVANRVQSRLAPQYVNVSADDIHAEIVGMLLGYLDEHGKEQMLPSERDEPLPVDRDWQMHLMKAAKLNPRLRQVFVNYFVANKVMDRILGPEKRVSVAPMSVVERWESGIDLIKLARAAAGKNVPYNEVDQSLKFVLKILTQRPKVAIDAIVPVVTAAPPFPEYTYDADGNVEPFVAKNGKVLTLEERIGMWPSELAAWEYSLDKQVGDRNEISDRLVAVADKYDEIGNVIRLNEELYDLLTPARLRVTFNETARQRASYRDHRGNFVAGLDLIGVLKKQVGDLEGAMEVGSPLYTARKQLAAEVVKTIAENQQQVAFLIEENRAISNVSYEVFSRLPAELKEGHDVAHSLRNVAGDFPEIEAAMQPVRDLTLPHDSAPTTVSRSTGGVGL